ncbi:MAG: cation transporter [Candidatus Krumholzibacteriota bacterium]|nr:cation transporter [Candidatus Krumholzibacteriota bacterium]
MPGRTSVFGAPGGGERVTWLGLAVNVVLFAVKTTAGLVGRSQVLLADGIHSLSDLATDIFTLVAYAQARKPRDREHPYGHGKIEDLGALAVGAVLVLVAAGMAWAAVATFRRGELPERSPWLAVAAAVSIVAKELLFRVTRRRARALDSPVLLANAWHHRSDALSSVAALAGIGLYLLLPAWDWADTAGAVLVAVFIVKAGVDIARRAARDLVDTAPPRDWSQRILEFVLADASVAGIRNLRGRYYAQRVALDMDIQVDPEISVRMGHDVARRLERQILARFREVNSVMIHIEPDLPDPDDVAGGGRSGDRSPP